MLSRTITEPRAMLARFGYAGFIFFFVKGMCWLLVPAFLAWYAA